MGPQSSTRSLRRLFDLVIGRRLGLSVAALALVVGPGLAMAHLTTPKHDAPAAATGRDIFSRSCASCHTLAAAAANGTSGPNLDQTFLIDRREGFGSRSIELIVLEQIKYATSPMPAQLIQGTDAEKVANFIAQHAGITLSAK